MFRITQSNVLKARIANQVVSNARNSLNHSIRFNSIALERSASQELSQNQQSTQTSASAAANLSFTKTIKDVASLQNQEKETAQQQQQQQQQQNPQQSQQTSNNYKNKKSQYKSHRRRESPWNHQLNAFEDAVNQIQEFGQGSQPFFWENVRTALNLYKELKGTPDFTASHVSKLVHLLHNGLRANRFQLTRLAKKPDYDSQSFLNEMQNFVKASLREIINDVLDGSTSINDIGAMHLLTSLKELHLSQEAIGVWSSCVQKEEIRDIFLTPRVVGVLLPLMFEAGSSFAEVQNLYDQSVKLSSNVHPNLSIGMIRTSLAANENEVALRLFSDLTDTISNYTLPYLIEAHLSFIGDCKDPSISHSFFQRAINRDMPYKMTLQVSSVKTYLENIYRGAVENGEATEGFNQVVTDWTSAIRFYGRNIHHGISSSLNNTFFDLFFSHYENDKVNGLLKLKEIISIYNDIKPIDEPFFNIIISKCGVWKDKSTIDALYQAYDIYNVKKTIVSRRIYLKSLGSVVVTEDEILQSWYDLLKYADVEGATYIANADWAAIRDSTVNSKTEAKPVLFAQIFKIYGTYCRDFNQYKRMKVNADNGFTTSKIFKDLDNISTDNIMNLNFINITPKQFV